MTPYQIDPPDHFLHRSLTEKELRQIYTSIGSDALRAFRQAIRSSRSVQNFAKNDDFLKLLDADMVNGDGFPTKKGKALEAFLAG